MNTVVYILLLIATSVNCLNPICPPKEDIKPCSCFIGEDKKPWIVCDGLTSNNQLQKAVQNMANYKLSVFYLENSNIGVLPSKLFSDVDIEEVRILSVNLTQLSENFYVPPFLGLEYSLEYLEIKDSFLNENSPLKRLSLSHLKKLSLLQMEGNLMPVISNDWFESGPYGLRELYLLDTSAEKLGSHAFASLQDLKVLAVTGGKISEIKRDMFSSPAIYLESIDFSNNQISTLPPNIFTKMPSLEEIYLENNALVTIDEVSFSQVWNQLSDVHFFANPLNCDTNMKWMYKYRLPKSLHGQCAEPQKLKLRNLSNLTLADFE